MSHDQYLLSRYTRPWHTTGLTCSTRCDRCSPVRKNVEITFEICSSRYVWIVQSKSQHVRQAVHQSVAKTYFKVQLCTAISSVKLALHRALLLTLCVISDHNSTLRVAVGWGPVKTINKPTKMKHNTDEVRKWPHIDWLTARYIYWLMERSAWYLFVHNYALHVRHSLRVSPPEILKINQFSRNLK
jgi:hypothetical protein